MTDKSKKPAKDTDNVILPESTEKGLLSGVFSSQEIKKVGTGTTLRRTEQKVLWFAQELFDGQIELQPINMNFIPSGIKKTINKEVFLEEYSPEPEVYLGQVLPSIREVNKTVARADRFRENKEYYSAEVDYSSALKVDEENVRANFGLGITYLERGDSEKASNIFERLVKLEAAFQQEHKHLFNEFGINLRKNKLYSQAVSYYSKSIALAGEDANLYYNLARAYFENKETNNALKNLTISLELNPGLEPSVKFLIWLLSKDLVPDESKVEIASVLKQVREALSKKPK